jgi:hypothetical protein
MDTFWTFSDENGEVSAEIAEKEYGLRFFNFSMWSQQPLVEDEKPRISYYGYCTLISINSIRLPSRTKIEFNLSWSSVVPQHRKISDRDRLINFISELPDVLFLKNIKHIDQIKAWMRHKNHAIEIAKCLQAGRETPDNPLERALREGEISQWRHDNTWLEVEFYEHVWKLCLLKGDKIRKNLKPDYNFDSNLSLCKALISQNFNSEYSLWMNSYHEENPRHAKKLATFIRKHVKGKTTEEDLNQNKELLAYFAGEGDYALLAKVLKCCSKLAKRDSWLKNWLEIKEVYRDSVAAKIQEVTCNPSLRAEGFGQSWIIREGQAIPKMEGWKA